MSYFTDPATGRRYTYDPATGQSVWLDQQEPAAAPTGRRKHRGLLVLASIAAGIVVLGAIGSALSSGKPPTASPVQAAQTGTPFAPSPAPTCLELSGRCVDTNVPTAQAETPTAAPSEAPSTEAATPQEPAGTASQLNALRSAQNYLDMRGFSRQGLIDQLSSAYGDQFSVADATWAATHVGANWNEQAVRAGKTYLEMRGFSRAGLIEQLSSPYGDKFTRKQATYAADKLGLK